MKARMQTTAGKIRDEATVDVVAKAEESGESEALDVSASARSGSLEYLVRDEAGHEETVDIRDFKMLR